MQAPGSGDTRSPLTAKKGMDAMLRRACLLLSALLVGLLGLLSANAPAQAASVTATNATQFTDTTGAVVHAHGGGVIKVGSYYYWFARTAIPTTPSRPSRSTGQFVPLDLGLPEAAWPTPRRGRPVRSGER
jgi:aconitase B